MTELKRCTNIIKLSILHNKKGFVLRNKKSTIKNLNYYLKLNVIKLITIKNNNIVVEINYINNKPVFKNLTNMYKSSNKKFIAFKTLMKISKKYDWIFLISTNVGIINNFEALKMKKGGLLVSKIWN